MLFNNIDLQKLINPLSIYREELVEEEEQEFGKKKTELIDYEDGEYIFLKEKGKIPLIVVYNDSKMYSGKLQTISDGTSMYFVLIKFKMLPIEKS